MDFAISATIEWKKKEGGQIPRFCQRAEKTVKHKGNSDTSHSWSPINGPQEPGKETGWPGDQRKNRDY